MTAGLRGRVRGARTPTWLGPTALLLISMVGVGAVIWGVFNPPDIRVVYHDVGPVDSFAIGEVTPFPEVNLYMVGRESGALRALDGRIQESGCVVRWQPDDARGGEHNPGARPGVFEDPCTAATWSRLGNAISGSDRPMRTPHINYRYGDTGRTHAFVELINP
jgi:hypothetical protein